MYSQGEIEDAVAAGALAPEQAASFREFVAARNQIPTADEEHFRLIRGYNDIFVAYACIAALIAVGMIGTLIPIGVRGGGGFGPFPSLPIMAPLFVTAASWGLAEIFTLRRRTALPSWLLAFSFGFGAFMTLLMILLPMLGSPAGMGSSSGGALLSAVAAAIAAAATWAFWLRFRVPVAPTIAVGLGVIATIAVLGAMFTGTRGGAGILSVIMFLIGIGVFAYAMWWDMQDRWRITDRNEVGLWMHGLAALLLVFSITAMLGVSQGIASVSSAMIMIVLFLAFALLSLVVNRKALLLTALAPLIQAVNSLARGGSGSGSSSYNAYGPGSGGDYNGPGSNMFGGTLVTVVVISLILLLLALFWSPIRRAVLRILPAGLRNRLAPSEATPFEQARHFE